LEKKVINDHNALSEKVMRRSQASVPDLGKISEAIKTLEGLGIKAEISEDASSLSIEQDLVKGKLSDESIL